MILEEAVRCVVDPRVKSEAWTGLRAALSLTLGSCLLQPPVSRIGQASLSGSLALVALRA